MDMYKVGLRENLWKLSILQAASGCLLSIGVIVIFFQENGLSLREIFILQAIFSVGVVAWEIPSGYISDRWGRKNTIIFAAVTCFLAYVAYALSYDFWGFVLAELLIATGNSFYSGTLDAMTYDTLLELEEEKDFKRHIGHQFFLHFGAEGVGSVLGGILAVASLRLSLWATLIPFGVACIVALTLTEPKRHKLQETRHFKAIWDICTHTLIHSVPMRSIVALHMIISTMTLSLFWLTQPYQTAVGLPLMLFGLAHGAIVIAGATASKMMHKIAKHVDDRMFLIAIALTVVSCYIGLGFVASLYGLLLFLAVRIAWGMLTPLTSDILNRMVSSDKRATVLSIRAFASRMLFVIAAPFIGGAADLHSLNSTFLGVGIIGGMMIAITLLLMHKVWSKIPQ